MAERYDFYVHDNRKITFNLTEPIMREDSGVTDFVFHIPKILNELEVSDWQWWLVFVNAKKEKYSIALTLSDDPESPLEKNVTTYTVDYAMSIKAGSVQFALEAINTGTGGAIDNEWHTLTYETKVKETLQGNQAEYAETESDIISALLEEVRTKMNQVIGGATPTPAQYKAQMTDPQKVYLYIGSEPNEHAGHWYYHNGTTFVSGGVYGAGVVDSIPTQGSANAVSSGGVYEALEKTPETATPEEVDADFYLSDENGNALMELVDGHIKTRNFDSSDIDPTPAESDVNVESQATDANADLYIADERGNAIVRFSDGNVQTEKFSSENSEYVAYIAYTSTAGKKTITHFFPKGTKIACHLVKNNERDAVANQTVTYSYTDKNGNEYVLGTDYGYNFVIRTLERDAVSISVTYGSGLTWNEDVTLAFTVYTVASFGRTPHVITVSASGDKDFTSLRDAIEFAQQLANTINQFEIHVYPGTYDTLSYFSDAEIATAGFQGLFLTNGISLIGIGQRSEIILTATMDTSDYTTEKRNDVSTLNVQGNFKIENITIKAENIRYAVHDDTAMMVNQEDKHVFENVTFIAVNNTSGEGKELAYGAGGGNLKKMFFKNCDFLGAMVIHTSNNMTHEYTSYLDNCRAETMVFSDYNSVKNSHVYLNNCNIAFLKLVMAGAQHAQFMRVEGTGGNNPIILSPADYVYAVKGVHKFKDVNIAVGKAVKYAGTIISVEPTTSLNNIYGISIGVLDGITYVQTEGWINSNTLGITGLAVGDYLTIDANGNVITGGTSANAIAQVRAVDNNGVAYAKLML